MDTETNVNKDVVKTNIVEEIKKSFLEYSMSVIVARALPDLRDGLKPVHRRILYSMYEGGYTPDKPFRKSAKTVGEVMGNYHPHGDSSIYDAMVRMAQTFSYRYVLIDGHGNFGSMDGDGAAAMRYTEARLSKLSLELLRDIKKDTIDFVDNFDATTREPSVLPSRFPNILVNGTMGIAVGMATNIPPHNLSEVIDGCVAYIDNHDITLDELMQYVKGPDFPTGAVILGNSGIRRAYETGKGSITLRGKVAIEENNGHSLIVITELPYMVNKKMFQQRIAELVRDKLIDGIADLHEETNLENGIRIVITLKKEANANVVLNNLYKQTSLQTNFGINFLMLDQMKPRCLGLKEIIAKYIEYQKEIIIRRTKFDLGKAEERVHILNGFKIALENIDEVVRIIRGSQSDDIAKQQLSEKFGLTEIQCEAILDMRLRRLTGLEKDKILAELEELLAKIEEYKAILANDELVLKTVKEELLDIKARYGDERRTYIDMTAVDFIEDESLIPEENVIISLTDKGYIKRCVSNTFKSQHRGGVGVKGMTTNEEDYVKHLVNCSTHDYVLFFTNKGKVYRIKGYEIPEYSRQAKGLPIINLLQIEKDEKVSSIIPVSRECEDKYLVFATQKGIVKRTLLEEYENIRQSGKIAISLRDDDELIDVRLSDGQKLVILGSTSGRMVIFDEKEIRPMGRTASGVKGIELDGEKCIGMDIGTPDDNILIVTSNGYGKKTFVKEYRMTKRGSKGVKALNATEKNGSMVAHKIVTDDKDLMIITESGMLIRLPIESISQLGRVTQGVKLINLKEEQKVSTISVVDKVEEIEEEIANSPTDQIEE
ncbi:MAG: DNA gyrase subunit A [Bacilli bacterium]|nr:DNA gyrase subunit A [Bacilli bacterium]